MGQKKKKLAKGRLDKFYYLAKEQGYRSRAAFKLIQLNKKYNFLGSAKACLDLCAAPGGWMQVASKYMPVQSVIVGVDLDPIRPIRNCIGLQEDITTAKCRTEIKKALKTWKVDICLHDGAPNMGTSWIQDAYQQAELTLHALKLATEFLTPGGWFVTKVFRGPDYNSLMWVFHQLFKKVDSTKPQASRNASAEIFVVCQGFLAPKKIDPKMLDPKHVFKEADTKTQTVDVMADPKTRKNRHRDGYEDDATDLRKVGTVKQFIEGNDHLQMLGTHWRMDWTVDAKVYEDHPLTTQEIKECLKDLKVLGKTDFKKLVKWKQAMSEYKDELEGVKKEEEGDGDDAAEPRRELTPEEIEANLDKLIDENLARMEKRKKREKRKQLDKRRDERIRLQMGMTISGDNLELSEETHLFAKKQIGDADTDELIGAVHNDEFSSGEDDIDMGSDSDNSDNELDDGEMMEQQLDLAYDEYMRSVKGKKALTVQVSKISKDKFINDSDDEQEDDQLANLEDDEEEQEEEEEEEKDNLKKITGTKRKGDSLWFKNSLFDGVEGSGEVESSTKDAKLDVKKPIKKARARVEQDEDMEEEEEKAPLTKKEARRVEAKANREKKTARYQKEPSADDLEEDKDGRKAKKKSGFEEVPAEPEYEDPTASMMPIEQDVEYETDSEEEEDEKVKTLAIGTAMLRKKARQDIVDDAYNRYAFNDDELPQWYVDDNSKHNKPILPITKEMVEEIKREIRAINSRPIKKVAEAKARKKRKQTAKLEKAKDKANSVVENTDLSMKEKAHALERIYKNADASKRNRKITLISRKFKTGGGKTSQYKVVDRRQKKELRAEKRKKAKK